MPGVHFSGLVHRALQLSVHLNASTIISGLAPTPVPTTLPSTIPQVPQNGTQNSTSHQDCSELIKSLSFRGQKVSVTSCEDVNSGSTIGLPDGPSNCVNVAIIPKLDIKRVTLDIVTSDASSNYVEVWMPSARGGWNGKFLATDNKGISGCPSYDDMVYTSSLGFAIVGDNGGHNASEYMGFDGLQMLNNNELVIDWSYRARHAAVVAAKQVIKSFYGKSADYSYMLGASNGGRQALQSAQMFPEDFDGIIAGAPVINFNRHIDWSGRMYVLTGAGPEDPKFLTTDDWSLVHNEVMHQCDMLDLVPDGIIEDSTICDFNATVLTCTGNQTTNCLTFTQTSTVWNVFSQLYDAEGNLMYPRLAPGAELQASTNGVLHGVQGHVTDWFGAAIWNNTSWNPASLSQTDYTEADRTDKLHGNVSSFNSDLSDFRAAGGKLIMYHGLMDPAVSAESSQMYYLNVARTMNLDYPALDTFFRFFRIGGMFHGSGGPGAWAFGQNSQAANATSDNSIINDIINWVEKDEAPDTVLGTKWWEDDPSQGISFQRAHCKFPFRTTFHGGRAANLRNWKCDLIEDWRKCGVMNVPRLC